MTIALSPNGRTLAAGTNTNKIFLFDTRTRRRLATLEGDDDAFVALMEFSPDGRHLAVGYNTAPGSVFAVFDVRSRRVVARFEPPLDRITARSSRSPRRAIGGLEYSPDGRAINVILDRPLLFGGAGQRC